MSAEFAQEQTADLLIAFARQQEGDLRLAQHASLPVVLSPKLLHLIRINFLFDEKDKDPPPFTAEADLLLSRLCHEIGDGLYALDPAIRNILLTDLVSTYGTARLHEVASLLWQYSQGASAWSARPGLERAQQLTALNILDPAQAAAWLADARAQAGDNAPVDEEWFVVMSREHEMALEAMSPEPVEPKATLTDADVQAYERGLAALSDWIPPGGERAAQLSIYSERLRAALAAERTYGATSTTRADRDTILEQLDALARAVTGSSFADLCSGAAQEVVELAGGSSKTTMSLKLNAEQIKELNQALIQVFPSRQLLRELLRYELNEDLESIADGPNLRAIVFDVIRWAESQGRLDELIQAARRANPGNVELRDFVERVWQAQAARPAPPDDQTTVPANQLTTSPLDKEERDRLTRLLQTNQTRLRILDLQRRAWGADVPADIILEFKDTQATIAEIETRLATSRKPVAPTTEQSVSFSDDTVVRDPDRPSASKALNSENDALLQLGIDAARESNRAQARIHFEQLTYLEPNNPIAWLWLAGVADGPEQRRAALERTFELDPTNEIAIKGLQALGVPVPARESIGEGQDATKGDQNQVNGDALLQLGIEAAREGDPEDARKIFASLTRQEPNNVQAWLWLACVADVPDQRRNALARANELGSSKEDIQAQLARIEIELGIISEPTPIIDPPPTGRDSTNDTVLQLGIEAAREGNREEARNLFALLTRWEPDNAQAWLWLAGVAEGPEQRRAALERSVELDPTNEMAIKGLQAMGVHPTARKPAEDEGYAAELDSAFDDYDTVPRSPLLGKERTSTGVDQTEAATSTRRGVDGDTILQLGIEAAREGNREEARNLFGLLTRQEPNNAQAWLWLAGVADGPEQRRAALERSLELDPTDAFTWIGMATIADSPEQRRTALARALQLDPTNKIALEELQTMGVQVPEREITDEERDVAVAAELDAAFDDYDAVPRIKKSSIKQPQRGKRTVPSIGATFTGTVLGGSGGTVRLKVPGLPTNITIGELEVGLLGRLRYRKGNQVRVTVTKVTNDSQNAATKILHLELAPEEPA